MSLIVPIVEGHGEIQALPKLLSRLVSLYTPDLYPRINPPIRVKAASFLTNDVYFSRYVELAVAKTRQTDRQGLVLILLDCDDDCPAELGPDLLRRAKGLRPDADFLITLAYREYESWFIAAAESLRGCCGLPMELSPPSDIDSIRGAKEWLSRRMPRKYDPLVHQLEFTKHMDLEQASALPSFRRFRERIQEFLE